MKRTQLLSILALTLGIFGYGCSEDNVYPVSDKDSHQNDCDDDDPDCQGDEACEDACEIGETKCSKGKLLTCKYPGNSECPRFVARSCGEDATCKKGKCVDSTTNEPIDPEDLDDPEDPNDSKDPDKPQTPSGCENECDKADLKTCDTTESGQPAWKICGNFDDDTCLEWSEPMACGDDETCTDGICSTGEGCVNQCPENLASECVDNGYHWCSDFNGDGCLEWNEITPCADGCKDGKCQCNNECTESEKRECHENGVRQCVEQNDGCLKWSEVSPCSALCQDGQCVCDHKCEEGAQQCSGDTGYVSCITNDEGCRIWSTDVTPCEHGCEGGECKTAVTKAPTRYPGDQLLSPVTEYSVQKMKEIASKNSSRDNKVFAKIGDSHFAPGSLFMYCFAKTKIDLNGATFLQSAIDAFKSGSTNSFSRDSVSAVVGKTAKWANDGGYITSEISQINPRFAFIGYGTNDMMLYDNTTSWFANLENYFKQYKKSLNTLMSAGVIPLVVGTGIRNDYSSYGNMAPRHFVPVFNAVNRGLAEYYQIPYFNLALGMKDLVNYGVTTSDAVHHNSSGSPCVFADADMKYGANVRNRYSIEMLYKAWNSVVQGAEAPDKVIPFEGSGTKSAPYVISSVPYTHYGTTSDGENNYSTYGCGNANEAGPEKYYELKLSQKTRIRAFVVSTADHDLDIYLKDSLSNNNCMTRGNRWVESELSAGTYYFVVETFTDDGLGAGEYLFGIVACDSDDSSCGTSTKGG